MSKFEELCQVYAAARKEYLNCKHSCQDFADFLVNRMRIYFECPIETVAINFDEDGYLYLETELTLYENPHDTANSEHEKINISLLIRKKGDDYLISYTPYSGDFQIPGNDLNKLDEVYEFIANKIQKDYESQIQVFRGKTNPFLRDL
ncbi:MAG: hypothetical protein AB4426_03220 [Xenococcaceae cyanobacterium]